MHDITHLFIQLGLPSSKDDIQNFIQSHRLQDTGLALSEAPFWTAAQAAFLREQIVEDADWAVVIDKLNTSLRQ